MKAASALAHLRGLGKRVVSTNDAALALGLEPAATTQTLKRLAAEGLLKKIRHGLWAVDLGVDVLALPEYLTAPFPAYVSFQSALSLHGMVSQVPEVIYVASLAQTRSVKTTLGAFSIHRLAPTFFGGYDTLPESGVHLATPEKSLLDTLYLGPARSRMFAHLPEVEIPRGFDKSKAHEWVSRIPIGPRRASVEQRLERLLRVRRRQRRPTSQHRRAPQRRR
ncbi:MAG TPA: type IV toxin-antitoxin system AbiEi family antitoxin domain-containing protein [Vicinamibacteria bacterium]|nr:type IV toxin-antitoxin system AbiEi family antitoxin domain-containing protein [Vicinamibacteria bacterium]